ncbi:site-specific integrase, partial [Enterococcus faecium]|nr:site-specific integrase [Enterococcus faecium]
MVYQNRSIAYFSRKNFLNYLELKKQVSKRTIDIYDTYIDKFFFYLQTQIYDERIFFPSDIVKNDILSFLDYLERDVQYAPATVNQYLTAIRVYFDFLLLTGSVVQNPTFRI